VKRDSKLQRLSKYLKARTRAFNKKSSDDEVLRTSPVISTSVDQFGVASDNSPNTQLCNTLSTDVTRVATPVQQQASTTAVLESVEPTQVFETPRVRESTEARPYWEVSQSTSPLPYSDIFPDNSTDLSQAFVDVVADVPAPKSPEEPSPAGSKLTVIRTRKHHGPIVRTHSRDISDASTLPVSLRTSASDSCLVAKHRVLSEAILWNGLVPSTKAPEDSLKAFHDLKLKSEKAGELLLKARELAHANEITALKDEHADAMNELEEAKTQFEQGQERADRSKMYLQKQLKKINAAKDDAEKTAKAARDQLAKQQAEYQELANALQGKNMQPQAKYQELEDALHWENIARKAAEENSEALKAQLVHYRDQYVTRDDALRQENSQLLGVISEIQLKNHELTFEQMRHVSCITQEQFTQVQEEFAQAQTAWKKELSAAQWEAETTRYKIRELQDAVDGTAGEDFVDQANTIKARTKQVEELVDQVKKLTTELEKVLREKITLEVKSKISTEAVYMEVFRLVASKDTLEKRLDVLQKAYKELLAYPQDLLRTSQSQLIEAGSKILESLRAEKDILATSLAGTTNAREAAEQEVALLKLQYNDLEAKLKESTEKTAELDYKMIMSDGETVRAEVQTEVVRYEKDKLIEEKDSVITGLEQVTEQYLQYITWLGQQGADSRTGWILQFLNAEVTKAKRDLSDMKAGLHEKELRAYQIFHLHEIDADLGAYHDYLFRQVSRDLHNCRAELSDSQDELRASEFECENLKAKVLLLEDMRDRPRSAVALRNAFAQSQEQRTGDGTAGDHAIVSPKSESGCSDQTVIKHEPVSELNALYVQYRNERLTPTRRKKVEEVDRQLAEEAQTEEYQFPGWIKSVITRPVTAIGRNAYSFADSTNSQLTALPLLPPGHGEGRNVVEEADRQFAEKLQAEEYQSTASNSSSIVIPRPIPYPTISEGLTYARPSPRPSPSTSFRAPLGDDYFYYHYPEWLAKKNAEQTAKQAQSPGNQVTEHSSNEVDFEGRRTAARAADQGEGDNTGEYDDDLNLYYYVTDEELTTSGRYTHEEIKEMLSPARPNGDEGDPTPPGCSMLVEVDEDELRISRVMEEANRLPYAGYEYIEEVEAEDETTAGNDAPTEVDGRANNKR